MRRLLDELAPEPESGGRPHGAGDPTYLPDRLHLLADLGVRGGDDTRVEAALDALVDGLDDTGLLSAGAGSRRRPKPERGALLCDTHIVTDVLCRLGRQDDPRVLSTLERIADSADATPQGRGWRCVPERRILFRGRSSRTDVCPQITLEALRCLAHLDEDSLPAWTVEAARTPLEVWRRRGAERPYDFGHGYQFKTVRWPHLWYDALAVLEAVTLFPEVWRGPDAREEDRRSLAELAACLLAYDFDEGRVVVDRTYPGYEDFSFGRQGEASPFATAHCLVPLARIVDLAEGIADVEAAALPGSSRRAPGADGEPAPSPTHCPVPPSPKTFPREALLARPLVRHHLGGPPPDPTSLESVVGDVVGLRGDVATTPYLSASARLHPFAPADLDTALYVRGSLVGLRAMRGGFFIVRRDTAPVVFAATSEQTGRYARRFARIRGIDSETLERLAPRVVELLRGRPMSTTEIRDALRSQGLGQVDVAALLNLMSTEARIVRYRPRGDWRTRGWTYALPEEHLSDLQIPGMGRDEADAILTRAYVRGFGPVTERDVAWWTGIGPKRTRRAIDRLGDELSTLAAAAFAEDTTEDARMLMHVADVDESATATLASAPPVHLLPCLDPFPMGYADRSRMMHDRHREYVFDETAQAAPVVMERGRITGVWDVDGPDEPTVLVHLFDGRPVSRAVTEEAEAVGRLRLDRDVRVSAVERMRPLRDSGTGAYAHPLRGIAE